MVFPVVMYGCESWTIKKAEHQRIDAFELCCWRTLLRVPWVCNKIKLVHPKGNQSWIFIGRTDAEAEAPTLWLPDVNTDSLANILMLGKIKGRRRRGREGEMVGWHPQLDGHEFEQPPGVGDGQGSLVCCSPWGHTVRYDWMTELNWKFRLPRIDSNSWLKIMEKKFNYESCDFLKKKDVLFFSFYLKYGVHFMWFIVSQ